MTNDPDDIWENEEAAKKDWEKEGIPWDRDEWLRQRGEEMRDREAMKY